MLWSCKGSACTPCTNVIHRDTPSREALHATWSPAGAADVPSNLKAKGWSDARAFAASQLRKNPNAYFYRHTAPGQPQAQGEWTEEEHEIFIATARKHGVGDKWGLFASYIPNRVGYQCSAYYTQVWL